MAKRDFDDDYDDGDRSWWYGSVSIRHHGLFNAWTRTYRIIMQEAAAIKWAVIGAIFLIALLWFFGGYYHAQRRMKKGLQPLAYHRVSSWSLIPIHTEVQLVASPKVSTSSISRPESVSLLSSA